MGGYGSGRWHYRTKSTTDNLMCIDVRRWRREGVLTPGTAFTSTWTREFETASINVRAYSDSVILEYRHCSNGGEWKPECYPVRLDWTRCNFGGLRTWFLCPVAGCGRRVAKLFCGRLFACRHCLQLAFGSQNEDFKWRAMRSANKLRVRLGWDQGILGFGGWRPKGMHRNTFERLSARHDALVRTSLGKYATQFGF